MGQFYYAAKAFDALEKLDPGSNYWEGKRGACVGVFQLILANKESKYVSFVCIRLTPFPDANCKTISYRSSCHYMIIKKINEWKRSSNKTNMFSVILFYACVFFREMLKEVIPLLQNSGNPQVEYIIRVLRKWAKDNRILLSWQHWTPVQYRS